MNEKLDHTLDTDRMKQTRSQKSIINYRDSAIDKL